MCRITVIFRFFLKGWWQSASCLPPLVSNNSCIYLLISATSAVGLKSSKYNPVPRSFIQIHAPGQMRRTLTLRMRLQMVGDGPQADLWCTDVGVSQCLDLLGQLRLLKLIQICRKWVCFNALSVMHLFITLTYGNYPQPSRYPCHLGMLGTVQNSVFYCNFCWNCVVLTASAAFWIVIYFTK